MPYADIVSAKPILRANRWNAALPAAEASLLTLSISALGADIADKGHASYMMIHACISVAGILRVARTLGGATVVSDLNSGVALVPDAAYTWKVEWQAAGSEAINLRYSVTAGTIRYLRVDEVFE